LKNIPSTQSSTLAECELCWDLVRYRQSWHTRFCLDGGGEACSCKSSLIREKGEICIMWHISDPAVTNQLYLWSISHFSITIIFNFFVTRYHAVGQNAIEPHTSKGLPVWKWLCWNKNKAITKTIF